MSKDISAEPVSGQGASIDTPEFRTVLMKWYFAKQHHDVKEFDALVQYIDSRPRSEDSRAKVLKEAAQACENERVEETGEGDQHYNLAIKHAAASIHALASSAATERSGEVARLSDADIDRMQEDQEKNYGPLRDSVDMRQFARAIERHLTATPATAATKGEGE